MDRLTQWAGLLGIPPGRLWFVLPNDTVSTGMSPGTGGACAIDNVPEAEKEEIAVDRRRFMASTGLTLAGGLTGIELPVNDGAATRQEAVEWFAWRLWRSRVRELHRSEIPSGTAWLLDGHPHVFRTSEMAYRFTDPGLIDGYVAQQVFTDITRGSGHLLATAQTTHRTDLAIGALSEADDTARHHLATWMRRGVTPVVRVNAAGILAKVGKPELGDAVVSAMRDDRDMRHLYLTAVAARVLGMPWEQAGRLAADAAAGTPGLAAGLEPGQDVWAVRKLRAELSHPRDAGARWCSAALLYRLPDPDPDATRTAFLEAARQDQCRENLRAYAVVLAGASPLS
jgi:hypothetical protein